MEIAGFYQYLYPNLFTLKSRRLIIYIMIEENLESRFFKINNVQIMSTGQIFKNLKKNNN